MMSPLGADERIRLKIPDSRFQNYKCLHMKKFYPFGIWKAESGVDSYNISGHRRRNVLGGDGTGRLVPIEPVDEGREDLARCMAAPDQVAVAVIGDLAVPRSEHQQRLVAAAQGLEGRSVEGTSEMISPSPATIRVGTVTRSSIAE